MSAVKMGRPFLPLFSRPVNLEKLHSYEIFLLFFRPLSGFPVSLWVTLSNITEEDDANSAAVSTSVPVGSGSAGTNNSSNSHGEEEGCHNILDRPWPFTCAVPSRVHANR